ncbi:MAG TPA: gamma-glutamyl-gamma-aminobutyrate hydrolase family protein [Myxococcota bacterium]|nr:gamma-glutamyl-gamma-aminobutyrate hydrolase family protein [Myxococcota bacterium]
MGGIRRARPRKAGLLILDNALDHDFYRPVEHWAALCGFEPESVHLPSSGKLPSPGKHSHVIVSGSEDTITILPAWARSEADWLSDAIDRGVHLLGSCWGHQLLAVAIAGPKAVRRCSRPELGWHEIEVRDQAGLLPSGSFHAFCSHFDEIVPDCHPQIEILADTPDCAVHAFRLRGKPVFGIQAHPEIDPETGRAFLQKGAERWPEHAEVFAKALSDPVRDDHIGRELVQRFLSLTWGQTQGA